MFKPAVILVVALLASASAQDTTAEQRALHDKVIEAYEKIDAFIGSVIDKSQEAVEVAREKAGELGDEVIEKVEAQVEKLNAQIAEFFEKVQAKVDDLVGSSDNPHAVECAKITESIRDTAIEVSSNTSVCLTQQIPKTVKHVEKIFDSSSSVLTELTQLRTESRQCVQDIEGFKQTVAAFVCLGKVAAKGTWISVKRVPEITISLGKLGMTVGRLPQTLSSCAVSNGFPEIIGNGQGLIDTVKSCIAEVRP